MVVVRFMAGRLKEVFIEYNFVGLMKE